MAAFAGRNHRRTFRVADTEIVLACDCKCMRLDKNVQKKAQLHARDNIKCKIMKIEIIANRGDEQ